MSNHATIHRQSQERTTDVKALVEAAQAGDSDAFGELYRMYYEPVLRAILRRVDHDHDLAEDLAQQAFLDAWLYIRRTQLRSGNVRAWFVAIGCNCARYYWTRLRPTDRVSYRDDIDRLADNPKVAAGIDRDSAARGAVVRRRIGELRSARQRRCLQLRYYEGLNQAQTAAEMGVRHPTARQFELRAIRHLERQLGPELYGTA